MYGPESIGVPPVPQEDENEKVDQGRRNFFRRAGAAAVGAGLAAAGIDNTEARESSKTKITTKGYELSELEIESLQMMIDKVAPGARIEFTKNPPDEYKNIHSVRYVIVYRDKRGRGAGAGYDEMDATERAIENALADISK